MKISEYQRRDREKVNACLRVRDALTCTECKILYAMKNRLDSGWSLSKKQADALEEIYAATSREAIK